MLSEKVANIPPFYVMEVLERAQQLEEEGRSIIHLEIGEPDFPTASHICDAAKAAMCAGNTRYTHSQGLIELRQAIAKNYKDRFDVDIDPGQIIVTSGTSPAMLLLFLALIDQGDEIIMSNPHYACYPNFVTTAGGVPDFIYTNEDNGFMLQPDELATHINPNTKAILINSPSNPTGQVLPAETLQRIAKVAGDVPVISDEIYQGLVYEGEDHTILEYTDNAFVLNGFSKLYAMTGWRLGYLISPMQYVRTLQKVQQNLFISTNAFVQHAGVAALEGPQEQTLEMVKTYNERRLYLIKRLRGIGFDIKVEPKGAYYVLADARKFSEDSLALSRQILEDIGVAVTPGIDFGQGGEGHLRFSYANSLGNIKEGMDRLEKYLNKERC
ncbi:MAG: (5-formylfuran-3-yl)methyl phosphate transaminase [Methanolobus sp.]|jgi:aspartate/methionine/tyrosine aminotransferase|uniref:pyridoxal phosphate-dependent aminotransferase n=1 Tax=Methanolobus sp. TaxID=1874737 RepID=UPI00258FFDBC|nr:pyridoxal phosphate-dependent aminotransferase [Methanolobus sp.]MDK2831972.1 (5-formylfuran-3-yl)methyl phosphate transaminase [Methanolobus sp.]MDK2939778.1 (5-formylfuran-3-yl)methyl phosphate transaminase [Methanolobus sp.]